MGFGSEFKKEFRREAAVDRKRRPLSKKEQAQLKRLQKRQRETVEAIY